MRRVAITGLGGVTALGADTRAYDQGLRAGRCGVRTVTLFDVSGSRVHIGAQAPDPTLSEAAAGGRAPVARPDRFGIQATAEAIAQSGLAAADVERAACFFGTGTGGAGLSEIYMKQFLAGQGPSPAVLVAHQPCSVTDLVCRYFRLRGPRSTFMTACSSSATAIGYAGDLIRLGRVDVAIAGGAEGMCRLTYTGFNALRATSPEPARPFDKNRKGLNLGEGSGVLVLEEESHARRRRAEILGYLAGYGITADAHHMTAPHPTGDGAARAMLAALADAGVGAESVDYINAHGTATPHNDSAEILAIKRVFGDRAPHIPISSTKSMVGHTLGAAGAIEAVASLLAMKGNYLPPTINHDTPEDATLDFVPNHARDAKVNVIMSSSFAFGGNNTVLVFTRN